MLWSRAETSRFQVLIDRPTGEAEFFRDIADGEALTDQPQQIWSEQITPNRCQGLLLHYRRRWNIITMPRWVDSPVPIVDAPGLAIRSRS